MPLVRSIVQQAEKNDYRFSVIVLGIVKSPAFQNNMKLAANPKQNREGN
jgi:hypothetical protein